MKAFAQTLVGSLRVPCLLLILALPALWLSPSHAQQLDPDQLPTLDDNNVVIHTDIAGQGTELPGAPYFPALSFTLESNRQDDWADPLFLGMNITIRQMPNSPPGTPWIPVGAISAVAIAVDQPLTGAVGEYDFQDPIIARQFIHPNGTSTITGATGPLERFPELVGWMHFGKLGTLSGNVFGSRGAYWATNPNIGLPAYVNSPNDPDLPGLGFGVYPQWINNASLTMIDLFSDPDNPVPLGGFFNFVDIIPTAEDNFGQPRRYFLLLALTELMPDNAQVQVLLNSLDILPSLNPVLTDASGTEVGTLPFIFPLRITPAQLNTGAIILSTPGAHFGAVANIGDGFYPGEAIDSNGIPQMLNPGNGQPGGPMPNTGPGAYPGYNFPYQDASHRVQQLIIGPHETPFIHSQENALQILSLELSANQAVGDPVLFAGFGMLFKRLGTYREIPGDGIDNDGDAYILQRNGLDDNLNGEDNDGNPATPNWKDGIDNDGDGETDEGIDEKDPWEGVDETFRITNRGFNGSDDSPLDENGNYQAELAPTDFGPLPIRDGIDNDGDGLTDEGIDELGEAIGLDPVQLAGRNEDKDYRTAAGVGVKEIAFWYENGIDDDEDGTTDTIGEGIGPAVDILRTQANLFLVADPLAPNHIPANSDRALTGEAIIDYVSRTFIANIEAGRIAGYFPGVHPDPSANNRLVDGASTPIVYTDTAYTDDLGNLVTVGMQVIGLDNDFDNLYDEDPRDGMDNDGDGLIDEDVTWCPLYPAADEEALDYFVDGFTVFGGNRPGVFDSGADEYYVDFNMNGVFDQGVGDGDGSFVSEYRGGGRGFPSLRNGESYFQLGFVFPGDNDGDGEDNDHDPSTPPVANGIDDDGDGFTDEGFNEDVNDSRSDAPVFINFDGGVPGIEIFRDNRTAGIAGFLDGADTRMEFSAAPNPFNPQYIVVSMLNNIPLLTLPDTDDANFDFFVTLWLDSEDGGGTRDLFGDVGAKYGTDFMIQVTGSDLVLTDKYPFLTYSLGVFDATNTALAPSFVEGILARGETDNPPQDFYPAGRPDLRQLTKRQVGRLVLEDMEGEMRGLSDDPNSQLGGFIGGVFFENGFRYPPEPLFQYMSDELAHSSNMSGPTDVFTERDFPEWITKMGFPLIEPDGLDEKPLIGINISDASGGDVAQESIDQIRVNFKDAPYAFGRAHFDPSDLNPLRAASIGDGRTAPPGVALYMDRYSTPGGDADGDGTADEDEIDFIDNDNDGLTDEDPPPHNIVSGRFDPEDVLVPINLSASSWDADPNDPVVRGGGHYVVLTPRVGAPIPPDDVAANNQGYDFFVTVAGSLTMDNYDTFQAFVRAGDILCSDGRNIAGSELITTPVRSTPPTQIAAAVGSTGLSRNSASVPVLSINTRDRNNVFDPRFVYDMPLGQAGPQRLRSFWLVFHENPDVNVIQPLRHFAPSDLAPLQNLLVPSPNTGRLMSLSGIAIYRDMPGSDTNGGFDDPDDPAVLVPDAPIMLSGEEAFGVLQGRPGAVQIVFDPPQYNGRRDVSPIDPNDPDPYEPLPSDDVGENEGSDLFVVIRTSNTISQGDSFFVSLTNALSGMSDTAVGSFRFALEYFPANPYHMLHPANTLGFEEDVSTQTGISSPLLNTQPFDAAPTMVFIQPQFIANQTVPTQITTSYTIVWQDGDDELDNDGDPATFPAINLYYAPADNLAARRPINLLGPLNGSLDGPDDKFVWDVRSVSPGVYRILGTIDDFANPIVLAQGGLVEVINQPPDIGLTTPVGDNAVAGGVVTLNWIDSDPENNASISLYIVPATGSASGATDGVLLATGIDEDPDGLADRFDVDLDVLLQAGSIQRGQSYFFLASIDDFVVGPLRPKFSRSPGTITIKDVPTVRVINPNAPLQDLLLYYDVTWTDRIPAGRSATLELFYSLTNFGYGNNVAVTQPVPVPSGNRIVMIPQVETVISKAYRWQVADGTQLFPNRPAPGDYYIFARITDNLGNFTGNFSAGQLRVSDHAVQVFSLAQQSEYALESFTIRWAGVSADPNARLAIYYDDDETSFNGRLVSRVNLGAGQYPWTLYRNQDATQRNVPVGSYYLYYEVEDNITNAAGRYRFYSPYVVNAGVPAVESPKMLLADGQAVDPLQADAFVAGKSLLDGLVAGTPHALRATAATPEHSGLYVLDENGVIYPVGGAAPLEAPELAGDSAVDMEASPIQGYYVLDSHGSIHALGGAPQLTGVFLADGSARDLELAPDGRGAYVLDAYGHVYRVGKTSLGYSFNLGAAIARDLELAPDGAGMYVLDGYGGIHVAGSARRQAGPVFGSDLATDLWVDPSGNGYYLLDKFGGIHTCGALPQLPSLRLAQPIARDLFGAGSGDLGMFWRRALSVSIDSDAPFDAAPDTDGDWVVWVTSAQGRVSGSDISYRPIDSGQPQTIFVNGDQTEPSIDHGVLVYTSREGLDDDILMIPDLTQPLLRTNLSRNFSVTNGTRGTDNQRQPDIAVREISTAGGPVALGAVTWSAFDSTNREWDVYLQLLARDGNGKFAPVPGGIMEISEGTNSSDQRDPTVAITELTDNHATVMVVYSDNRNGDLDLVYGLVQVSGSGLTSYAREGGILVADLVRRTGAQVDPRVAAGDVVFTDESAGGDIYAIRMNLADPRHPVPAGAEIAVATSLPRQFAGRVVEGDSMAWIDRYNSFFDVVVADPRIGVFDQLFPGMYRPQTLGLVSPLNGFAEVYSLRYSHDPLQPSKWLVWSERREGVRRVVLYEQTVQPASSQ